MKKILFLLLSVSVLLSSPQAIFAREASAITDWYIQRFSSDIVVNTDGSVTIKEKILADCGNLPNKHGIFRVLPTFYQETFFRRIPTTVSLISIQDPQGNNYQYEEIADPKSITWKIGDPYQVVTGAHEYDITYRVTNAIRNRAQAHDEFYWNLNGNFWDIETDSFDATIHFPADVPQAFANTDYYIGAFGEKSKDDMQIHWKDARTLLVTTGKLYVEEGATISVLLPKGVIHGPLLSWQEMYNQWLWYLFPLSALVFCFFVWFFWGRDPRITKSIMPEYGPPAGWDVMTLSVIYHNGKFDGQAVTAGILSLATRNILAIEDVEMGMADWTLRKLPMPSTEKLSMPEEILLAGLFKDGQVVHKSDLQNVFHTTVTTISSSIQKILAEEAIFTSSGTRWTTILAGLSWLTITVIFFLADSFEHVLILLGTAAIFFFFAMFMPKLTAKGLEIKWQLKGFSLFMKTAEQHRQIFMEKEGLFEKLLPYAIVFGLVKQWVTAMQQIYGAQVASHTQVYWGGVSSAMTFTSADSFTQNLQSFTSHMSSTMVSSPSSSGSGGGGSSGGGGGGGGGGGW